MNWAVYHIGEELFIGIACLGIARRAFVTAAMSTPGTDMRNRVFLVGTGFVLLGISSIIHASVHAWGLNLNLLYQSLFGYCLGLLTIILGIATDDPGSKRWFPLLYLPLLALLYPPVSRVFPIFGDFRPLVWVGVAYLSGVVCMLYIAVYYRTRARRYIFSSAGHALICLGAVLLFFPASIGSAPWVYGHLLRPLGFIVLVFSVNHEDLMRLSGSFLYKALAAFSLIAAIPLLLFGTVIFYENVSPVQIVGKRLLVFVLLLATLASGLLFGLGVIIRLIRPLLLLKRSVGGLVERGLNEHIEISSNDEIGELTEAFNEMVQKLRHSITEQDRLSRLAATGELSATLAHEIRNPLNAIGGAATYIGENYQGSLVKEFTRIIEHEVARINKLTTALLNFAKPVQPEPGPGDINALVRETATLLKREAEEQDTRIEVTLGDDIPEAAFDYNQITQVLFNLTINALDAVARRETERLINIETRSTVNTLLMTVEDNGEGIPEEHLDNIFNPFFTTKTRGTGLGLAMSKKIAREHGGDLMVESVEGRGCRFTLALPVRA